MRKDPNFIGMAGRLTKDPQVHALASGSNVVSFNLVSNDDFSKNGVNQERPCFIDVKMYGKIGDIASAYLKKGSRVFVEGKLHMEQWEDKKTKEKRTRHVIAANSFNFLDGKPVDSSTAASTNLTPVAASPTAPSDVDDDIPF